ncbi:hypothetical protein HII31_03914 [Pseudocercospora fuligena]|uniref:Uncharacterized protein n=1 Tax=Pseudocercospora fuligena TaxID=685502 RepID=A0A8H6RLW3_9PEZI|nr:hypothetical protein HII31_03914 [Pseudocercospora fuligena]
MSHPAPHTDENGVPLKPRPRVSSRPFELGSPPDSAPPTPPSDEPSHDAFPNDYKLRPLKTNMAENNGATTPAKTRSFLNLTSSTLFGIYQPSGLETENPTPYGAGAQTPAGQTPASDSRHASFDWSRVNLPKDAFQKTADGRVRRRSTAPQLHKSHGVRKGFKGYFLPLLGRVVALFSVGVLYGLLISHLHDRQRIAPVAVNLDRSRWSYLATWGIVGVLLGEALPYADKLFWSDSESALDDEEETEEEVERRELRKARGADGWLDVVRSIGAFVGIAFAIRKLPWQSTLQLSLTLALANPAVWYLIDRSSSGFVLSTLVALGGTGILLSVNPSLVPPPSPVEVIQEHVARTGGVHNGTVEALKGEEYVLGIFTQESVGVATWIASVLFVSSVCFGNIGRRLSPERL